MLPTDSKARKEIPLWTFISTYFPKTFVAMAKLSYLANEKHNPGEPMHWAREKSTDHKDCIARHLLDEERLDEFGIPEAVAAAWRACANAELVLEKLQITGEECGPLPLPEVTEKKLPIIRIKDFDGCALDERFDGLLVQTTGRDYWPLTDEVGEEDDPDAAWTFYYAPDDATYVIADEWIKAGYAEFVE